MAIITAIIAAVAAISSIIGVVLTWHLGNLKDAKGLRRSEKSELRQEYKKIYMDAMKLFEVAEKSVRSRAQVEYQDQFSELSARISLSCYDDVEAAYYKAAHKFEEWANEHVQSLPKQWAEGDKTFTMLQYPNPYEKHEKAAKEIYPQYNSAIRDFLSLMKSEYKRIG